MKRIIRYLLTVFLLFTTFSHVYALEVSKSDLTIEKGGSEKIELYANSESELSSVTFTLVYSTYDIPASFYVVSGASDSNPNGITHTISFDEAKSGKILLGTIEISVKRNASDTVGSVNIHTASGKTAEGETVNLNNRNINIKVGASQEEPTTTTTTTTKAVTEIDKNLLEKIDSKIVKITLKKDQFDYTVKVNETIDELDLKPIAKDKDTKIEISSQKLSELKDNKITITAKNGEIEQVYNITINTKEDVIVIDKEEFNEDKSYKGKWIVVSIVLVVALLLSMLFNRKK